MKRLRQLVLALALLAIAALILFAGPLRDTWQEPVRGLVERLLTTALGAPTTIDVLSISLVPPRVVVRGVWLGGDRRIASLESARIHLRLRTSLRQGQPVLDLSAARLTLDLPALLHALPPPPPGPPTGLPAFRLRRVRVREVEVQLTDDAEPLRISAPAVDGELASDAVYGRLDFSARLEPATVQHGGRTAVLTTLAVAGGEGEAGWQLRRVFLRGEGVSVTGSERDDVLRLTGEVELPRLVIIDEGLASLRGVAQLKGRLQGTLEAPVLNATVQVPSLGVDEQPIGDVEATARLDRDRLDVSSLRVRGYGGEAEGSAALELAPTLPATARLTWRGLALRELAGAGASDLPPAVLEGSVALEGTLDPLATSATASGRVSVAGGAAPLQWKGSGRYADGGGTAAVEMSQGFGNTAKADLSVAGGGALGGRVQLRIADADALADLAAIESRPNLRGRLDANATLAGTLSDPRYEGALDARSLVVAGVPVDTVSGRFAGDRHTVRTDGLRAAVGGGSLRATGTVALDATSTNAWSVSAQGLDGGGVAALVGGVSGVHLPIGDGAFTLEASANGPWPRVQLAANLRLEKFWLGRERISDLTATAHAADGAWTAEARMRNLAQQEAVLRATGRGSADLSIALDCRAWTLTSLWRGEEADMGGTIRASAALRGPAAALSGTATFAADALVLGGRAFRDVQVDVTAERGRWRATTAVLDDALQIAAEVRPDPGYPFTFDTVWNEADFAGLIGAQPGWQVLSSGTLRATGRLNAIRQLEARLDLTKLTVTGGAQPVSADVPVTIACRNGLCTIAGLTLRSGDASLRITGDAGFDGRLRLALAGGGTLGMLELADEIESARGTFAVDATVTHAATGWSALGTLSLTQAALDAGLPVAITRTDGRLRFDGTRMHVDELRGRIGSGTFTIGGDVDLRDGPALTWTLTDVGADPLPSLEVEAGGRGAVAGTWQSLRVSGDVDIIRLLYDRNIELGDFLFRFNRALAAAPREAEGTNIELALTVRAPGELFVENNLTRMEARAQLSLTGTADHPVLDGRVEALDGDIFLRGRTFELLSGIVDFRPDLGMTAALNITAESLIDTPDGSYVVTVRVTGTTVEPRVTLSSDDPSLSQTDIATLIAFGRTASQLRQGGGGFSLTSALGNPIGDLLSGQAERVLPIDRIEFEPTFSTTTGAFEPQLTLGKDLTQDLAASIGQTFGISSRTRVEVNYRLGPNVWALGLWESQTETEAGAWAGGLRTRYQFWRLTPYTLVGGLQ